MSHPVLGLPPADPTAGRTAAAARLRDQRSTLGTLALKSALAADPTLDDRYDDITLRTLLRDYERHIEQFALALETGESRHVTEWAEWIVPIYRRRRISTRDQQTLIGGLRRFDLIWTMTGGGPGFSSDVLASVVYKQYQAGFFGLSTAGNVVLFVVVAAIIFPLSWWLNRKEDER